jgi:hypothetical protein
MTLSIEIDQKTEEFLFIGKQSYEVVTKYTAVLIMTKTVFFPFAVNIQVPTPKEPVKSILLIVPHYFLLLKPILKAKCRCQIQNSSHVFPFSLHQ